MTSLEFVKGYSRNTKNKKSRAKLSILYFLYYSKDRSSRGLTIHNSFPQRKQEGNEPYNHNSLKRVDNIIKTYIVHVVQFNI